MDEFSIRGGDEWRIRLLNLVQASQWFLYLVGVTGTSRWQGRELSIALDHRHRTGRPHIVPILLPGTRTRDLAGTRAAQFQAIRLTALSTGRSLQHLLDTLRVPTNATTPDSVQSDNSEPPERPLESVFLSFNPLDVKYAKSTALHLECGGFTILNASFDNELERSDVEIQTASHVVFVAGEGYARPWQNEGVKRHTLSSDFLSDNRLNKVVAVFPGGTYAGIPQYLRTLPAINAARELNRLAMFLGGTPRSSLFWGARRRFLRWRTLLRSSVRAAVLHRRRIALRSLKVLIAGAGAGALYLMIVTSTTIRELDDLATRAERERAANEARAATLAKQIAALERGNTEIEARVQKAEANAAAVNSLRECRKAALARLQDEVRSILDSKRSTKRMESDLRELLRRESLQPDCETSDEEPN